MQNTLINSHNFALKPHTFQLPSGINNHNYGVNHDDDIEMIAFESNNYTSLKDLLPASPSSATSTASPVSSRRDSWREIPIKDPLLQLAAWAYLQPMVAEPDEGDRWWWRRFQKKWCRLFGCFNDVVLVAFESWFPDQGSERLPDVGR